MITRRDFAAAVVGTGIAAKWFPRKKAEPKAPTLSSLRLIDVEGRTLPERGMDHGDSGVKFVITAAANVDGCELPGVGYMQFRRETSVMAGDTVHVMIT